jgi:hypothetical protein
MSFPPGTEMFQFPGFALPKLCIHFGNNLVPINSHTGEPVQELIGKVGFPHSEIAGSKVAHTSPALIAACHVLHRLCMPRHPRNTLTSRLRVRTTNDSAGELEQVRAPLGHAGAVIRIINLSLYLVTISWLLARPIYCHGIDFKNPFTMSKRGIIPHIASAGADTKLFSVTLEGYKGYTNVHPEKWWSLTGSNR